MKNYQQYFEGQLKDCKPKSIKIPKDALCQEASAASLNFYIPCTEPATCLIYHAKDRRSYWMCTPHGDHNTRNRGGILVAGTLPR